MNSKIYKGLAVCLGSLLIAATANAYHGGSSGVSFGISIGGDDGSYRHGRYYDNDYWWYRQHHRHHRRHHYDGDFYRHHHRNHDHDRRGDRRDDGHRDHRR